MSINNLLYEKNTAGINRKNKGVFQMESELGRELLELNKELTVQLYAHTQILSALLNIIDRSDLQRLKTILEVQTASGELQGLAGESCRVAVQLVSLATDESGPVDPRKLLHLIPGGKKGS